MRTLLALALVFVACGNDDPSYDDGAAVPQDDASGVTAPDLGPPPPPPFCGDEDLCPGCACDDCVACHTSACACAGCNATGCRVTTCCGPDGVGCTCDVTVVLPFGCTLGACE